MRSSFVFMPWRLSLDDVKGEKQVTWVPALRVIKNILVSHHPHHNTCTLYTCSTVHREPLLSVIKKILVPCCLNHNTCTLYTYSTVYREPLVITKCHQEDTGSPSSSSQHLHTLHLQHRIQGAANNRNGEATNKRTPKPANIPITWKNTFIFYTFILYHCIQFLLIILQHQIIIHCY